MKVFLLLAFIAEAQHMAQPGGAIADDMLPLMKMAPGHVDAAPAALPFLIPSNCAALGEHFDVYARPGTDAFMAVVPEYLRDLSSRSPGRVHRSGWRIGDRLHQSHRALGTGWREDCAMHRTMDPRTHRHGAGEMSPSLIVLLGTVERELAPDDPLRGPQAKQAFGGPREARCHARGT